MNELPQLIQRQLIHTRGPLMSGQAAESGGSRPFIHTKAMPSPGQYCWRASSIYLFIQPFGRALANAGASLPASIYSYGSHAFPLPVWIHTASSIYLFIHPAALSSNPVVGHIRSLIHSSRYGPVASIARQPLNPGQGAH